MDIHHVALVFQGLPIDELNVFAVSNRDGVLEAASLNARPNQHDLEIVVSIKEEVGGKSDENAVD